MMEKNGAISPQTPRERACCGNGCKTKSADDKLSDCRISEEEAAKLDAGVTRDLADSVCRATQKNKNLD